MKLKDVIHLYLGKDCEVNTFDGSNIPFKIDYHFIDLIRDGSVYIKPILLPLSSLTSDILDKKCKIWNEVFDRTDDIQIADATATVYLLELGFDLFGLIDSGQAIDKTKL